MSVVITDTDALSWAGSCHRHIAGSEQCQSCSRKSQGASNKDASGELVAAAIYALESKRCSVNELIAVTLAGLVAFGAGGPVISHPFTSAGGVVSEVRLSWLSMSWWICRLRAGLKQPRGWRRRDLCLT